MTSSSPPRTHRRRSKRRGQAIALVGGGAMVLAMLNLTPGTITTSMAARAGEQVALSPWVSPPPSLSTSGDFATDVFADPWDFSNPEDLIAIDEVGTQATNGVSIGDGMLNVMSQNGSTVRLLFKWPGVLPWGRDGWANPLDAGRYTQTTFRFCTSTPNLSMAIRFENAFGQQGVLPFTPPTGCSVQHFDLTYQGPVPGRELQYPFPGYQGPWAGPMTRFELFRGGGPGGVQLFKLDWLRVHRADASQTPPAGLPVPQVLTPNVEGGADYATVERGSPWRFNSASDIASSHDVANLSFSGGALSGSTIGNDGFIGLPLGPEVNTDRYHRMTVSVCYGGGFSLSGAAGGGMVGRVAWMPKGSGDWTETQDFVVFPGCRRMTLDLATNPALAVHDESSLQLTGWRGMRFSALRYDLNEDPGLRAFTLNEVRLADDAAFSSTYPITFSDGAASAGATADIYVTTNRAQFDGTLIAHNLNVVGGVNTFTWDGRSAAGDMMPNGTYWVYVVMHNSAGVATGVATGPLRLERPVPSTPSYFVGITPLRILDTRDGTGGNATPLGGGVFTELDVTGQAGVNGAPGVPETHVTAVVINVTVDAPTSAGYITAWPSGEPQPDVSNLNFAPRQTVSNLVTVKVGVNGRVNLFNYQGYTSVVADVVGYYTDIAPPSGGRYTPLTPARVLDTRNGTGRGGLIGAVGPGASIDVPIAGAGGVPSTGVSAVALNVTVDQPTAPGYITTWPTGVPQPLASTHNFVPGLTVANLVLVNLGADGKVSLFNSSGSTHLVADVIGYFSSSGGRFVPVTPQRLVDTRDGRGGRLGSLGPSTSFATTLTSPDLAGSQVPSSASGVVVNVTADRSSATSYVTAWPTGVAKPDASTMNPRPGVAVPNQAYLKLGSGGSLSIYNDAGSSHVMVDVFGYIEG